MRDDLTGDSIKHVSVVDIVGGDGDGVGGNAIFHGGGNIAGSNACFINTGVGENDVIDLVLAQMVLFAAAEQAQSHGGQNKQTDKSFFHRVTPLPMEWKNYNTYYLLVQVVFTIY